MLDPLSFWSRAITVSLDLGRIAMQASETVSASRTVIDRRSSLIHAAIADPVNADISELSKMVPEKVTAFSLAGTAVLEGCNAWNKAANAEVTDLVAAMYSPVKSPLAWMTWVSRRQAFGLRAAEHGAHVSAAVLKPVRAKAISNAKRLGKRTPAYRVPPIRK